MRHPDVHEPQNLKTAKPKNLKKWILQLFSKNYMR